MDEQKLGLGQRWSQARPTKTGVFFSAVVTMIVGFTWGGWVTASTARSMSEDTIVSRLAPICVGQFSKDPGKELKLRELKEAGRKQGWATMPGEADPGSRVADECAKLLILKLA